MSNDGWRNHTAELVEQGRFLEAKEFIEFLSNDFEAPYFMTDEYDNLFPIYCYEDIMDIETNGDFKVPEPEAEISL